jgi:subtilisin family serine protease
MNREKIAPELLVMVNSLPQQSREDFSRQYQQRGVIADNTSKPARVIVFITCDSDADLQHLAEEGIVVNQQSGNIRTAFLPVEKIGQLSDEPAIHRIQPTQTLQLKMDKAASHVGLPAFKQTANLTGRGVIIGIVDSGIDPKHTAFSRRVFRVWDQEIPGPGVREGRYGAELTGQLRQVSRDFVGHGTHVAGIAAGKDAVYSGVAPGARLVIVKTDMNDGHIADAIAYVFRLADEQRCPVVINLSLGGHVDAHDGSDPLSQRINDLSGPGHIVCCAAGNEGDYQMHARATVTQGQDVEVEFRLSDKVARFWLNGRFGGDDAIAVALRSPGGHTTPFFGPGEGDFSWDSLMGEGVSTILVPDVPEDNGDRRFWIDVLVPKSVAVATANQPWRLLLRNNSNLNAQVDVWSGVQRNDRQPDQPNDFVFASHGSDDVKVGSPGTAADAITVASYTTRVEWKDIHGHQIPPQATLHDISSFSSEGPLRNGAQKPDVAAPGAWIVSALSADSPFLYDPDDHHATDQYHVALPGTSMATPFITGLVALLLEHNPQLDPAGVKQALRAISFIPGQPAGTFDPKWGYGLIDASKLTALLQPVP